jgi:D-amino-acid dehydrogenase
VKVVVMGAGLAGVTTAWYLAKDGHEVVVIDREPEVAARASSANAGIIAASRAFPWSGGEIGRALRRSTLRFDPELWLWGVQHLLLRTGRSYRRILEAKVRLVRYSQQVMHELAREIGFEGLRSGVLYLHRDAAGLDDAWQRAEIMRAMGFAVEMRLPAGIAELEPAIDAARLAGALYSPHDESADAGRFCRSLAERLGPLGVHFTLGNEILAIEPGGARIREVVTSRGPLRADAFVCALGVMDRKLREQLGTHVPVYPVKGFSATVPIVRGAGAPQHAMIDESRRVAFSPLGGGELRITGGADFAGYGMDHQPQDFSPLYDAVKQLFPGALDFGRARVRACLRPMTPETTPRFGTGGYQNLWFNIGLGHMGFTMAAGAARITADLVSGHSPPIDLEGLKIRRH